MALALAGKQSGQRREDGPARPGERWPGDLSAQHRDLMSQHEDLGVVGRLAAGQAKPADELTEAQIEESERHGWRSSRASATGAKPQVNPMEEVFGTHRSSSLLAAGTLTLLVGRRPPGAGAAWHVGCRRRGTRRLTPGGVPRPRTGTTAGRSAARRSRRGPRAGASS